jgi:hypothetical protein
MKDKYIRIKNDLWKQLKLKSVETETSIKSLAENYILQGLKEKEKEIKIMKKEEIITDNIIDKLTELPEGEGWKLLIWKNGDLATIIGNGYAGEQDGDNPILILNRDDYGELHDDDDDADMWDEIERQIEEAGGEYTRKSWMK